MTVGNVMYWLGGRTVLGASVRSELAFAHAVAQGLPTRAVDAMVKYGALTQEEVERFIVKPRTLAYRRKHKEPLSTEESDRLARAARLTAFAVETFQNEETAARWMRRPNRALDTATPLELIATSDGARLVEEVLGRVAHGLFS